MNKAKRRYTVSASKEAQRIVREMEARQPAIDGQPYKIRQFAGYLTGSEIQVAWMTRDHNGNFHPLKKSGKGSRLCNPEHNRAGTVINNTGKHLLFEYQDRHGNIRRESVTLADFITGVARIAVLEQEVVDGQSR